MTKKKKIIVMSSLVFLLALTAVLNVLLARNGAAAGEDTVTTANYFATYRSERTTARSEELLQLDSIIALYDENPSVPRAKTSTCSSTPASWIWIRRSRSTICCATKRISRPET